MSLVVKRGAGVDKKGNFMLLQIFEDQTSEQ